MSQIEVLLQTGYMLMSVVRVTTEDYESLCGVCCHQGAYWSKSHALPPEAMLTSVVHAATKYLVSLFGPSAARSHAHGLCWRPTVHAPVDWEEQRGYFCCDIYDCRCTVERNMEGFSGNPYPISTPLPLPPKYSNSLERKPQERSLKKCDWDAEEELSTPQLMASGRSVGRKGLGSF